MLKTYKMIIQKWNCLWRVVLPSHSFFLGETLPFKEVIHASILLNSHISADLLIAFPLSLSGHRYPVYWNHFITPDKGHMYVHLIYLYIKFLMPQFLLKLPARGWQWQKMLHSLNPDTPSLLVKAHPSTTDPLFSEVFLHSL